MHVRLARAVRIGPQLWTQPDQGSQGDICGDHRGPGDRGHRGYARPDQRIGGPLALDQVHEPTVGEVAEAVSAVERQIPRQVAAAAEAAVRLIPGEVLGLLLAEEDPPPADLLLGQVDDRDHDEHHEGERLVQRGEHVRSEGNPRRVDAHDLARRHRAQVGSVVCVPLGPVEDGRTGRTGKDGDDAVGDDQGARAGGRHPGS